MGDSSIRVVRAYLPQIPNIVPGCVIHDNGCGSGTFIDVLLEAVPDLLKPTPKTNIYATDLMPAFVEGVKAHAESRGWSDVVQASVMPAESLSIPDGHLTHTFTNFVIQATKDPQQSVNEVYRTLRPGGVAVMTSWAKMPHGGALERTREKLYKVHEAHGEAETFSAAWLESLLERAKFKEVKIVQMETQMEHESLSTWSNMAWSFMGMPPGGWTETDEKDWEANTALFGQECVRDGFEVLEDGRVRVKMLANVAIAWKDE